VLAFARNRGSPKKLRIITDFNNQASVL